MRPRRTISYMCHRSTWSFGGRPLKPDESFGLSCQCQPKSIDKSTIKMLEKEVISVCAIHKDRQVLRNKVLSNYLFNQMKSGCV